MRHFFKYGAVLLVLLGMSISAHPQAKKYKARVSLEYVKMMNKESYIGISAKFKGENGFEQASDLEFNLYQQTTNDSLVRIGKVRTNAEGKAKFTLKNSDNNQHTDTLKVYTYTVAIENNEKFREAKKSISFSDASLLVDIEPVDSAYQIKARLVNASNQPVQGEYLNVGLKRLYGSLQIGKATYETDDTGSIIVPIEEQMPGIEGNLTFEVSLNESDTYGTIKALISAPIGVAIEEESSFDQRTMWSPPDKTPFYLLIFPNLMILGVWIPLLLLTFNLYRISKSKNR